MSFLSLIVTQTTRNMKLKKDRCHPLLQRQMMQWLRKPHKTSSWSTALHLSRPPSRAQSNQRTMMPTWKILTVPAALPQKRMIALATVRARPEQEDRRAAGDDARSVIPPQNVNHPSDSPGSHFSESPIKRRPGPKAHTGRAQPKKSQITCLNIQATARQRSRTCATAGHAK